MSKGISLNEFGGLALAFAIVAIIISIGGTILTQVRSTQTTNALDYNATTQGLSGITTMSQWLPTIAVIVAAAVVIGVIVNYFRAG
jgi:type II secretory pathway component PulF